MENFKKSKVNGTKEIEKIRKQKMRIVANLMGYNKIPLKNIESVSVDVATIIKNNRMVYDKYVYLTIHIKTECGHIIDHQKIKAEDFWEEFSK